MRPFIRFIAAQRAARLKCPVAVLDTGTCVPVGLDAGDGEVWRAQHEIHMRSRAVDAVLFQLFLAHAAAAANGVAKALAQRKVARGVFRQTACCRTECPCG